MSTEPALFHWAWKIPTGLMPQVRACAIIPLSSMVKHSETAADCDDFEMKATSMFVCALLMTMIL